MRIIIDIGHPAHVHLFKNFARAMEKKGHAVLFTAKEKEMTLQLLESGGFDYVSLGKPYKTIIGKIMGIFKFNYLLFKVARRFKPHIFLSHGSFYAAHVSFLLRKPHIALEDTGNYEQVCLYKPFTNVILTGTSFKKNLGKKQHHYNGYHELAYLHPNWFEPDKSIYRKLGLAEDQPYVILRFVSWSASHDIGHKGISMENKRRAAEAFSKYARVFISSEEPLPPDLEPYRFNIAPHHMHHALAFASLIFGESPTMASESAALGVPAVYLNNSGRCFTMELENKYRLAFNFTESPRDQEKAIQKGLELLKNPGIKQKWQERRQRLLDDNIDVTAFLVQFVENYLKNKLGENI